jgi:hypothetical protein
MVLAKKVIMDEYTINFIEGEISFDANIFNITNPEDITIYHRSTEGQGEFSLLQTTYNQVTKEIKAEFDDIGEFIFTYPDVEHEVFRPEPVLPPDHASMNYNDPVKLEWSPKGFFNGFSLQVATDSNFTTLLMDSSGIKGTLHELDGLAVNTDYYWRVKTANDGGESEWSDTAHFKAVSPYIDVIAPDGDEVWTRGLDHFIEWDDNINEDVILELYHNNDRLLTIDTVESRNAYLWSIPAELDSACMYHIRISSLLDTAIRDVSQKTFSINDSVCSGAPVPYMKVVSPNGGELIEYEDTVIIAWENSTGETVTVDLYKAGVMVRSLGDGIIEDTIHWIVPGDIETGDDYRIVISGEGSIQMADASNGDFGITDAVNVSLDPVETAMNGFNIYPNPVKGILNIEYTMESNKAVTIKLFNLAGMELETILYQSDNPGLQRVQHNMENHPAGTYVIRIQSDNFSDSKIFNYLK